MPPIGGTACVVQNTVGSKGKPVYHLHGRLSQWPLPVREILRCAQDDQQLQFRVNANEGATRGSRRTKIAHETIFRSKLHVTGGTVRSINKNRTDRRGEWIFYR